MEIETLEEDQVLSQWPMSNASGRCIQSSQVGQTLLSPIVLSTSDSDVYSQIIAVDLVPGDKQWAHALGNS